MHFGDDSMLIFNSESWYTFVIFLVFESFVHDSFIYLILLDSLLNQC